MANKIKYNYLKSYILLNFSFFELNNDSKLDICISFYMIRLLSDLVYMFINFEKSNSIINFIK